MGLPSPWNGGACRRPAQRLQRRPVGAPPGVAVDRSHPTIAATGALRAVSASIYREPAAMVKAHGGRKLVADEEATRVFHDRRERCGSRVERNGAQAEWRRTSSGDPIVHVLK